MATFGLEVNIFDPTSELFLSDRHETPGPVVAAPAAIATPCVQVCIVDGPSGLCLGCYRTLTEIAGWRGLSDTQRETVMAELPGRAGRIDPAKLGHKLS